MSDRITRVILLTGPSEQPPLVSMLQRHNPALDIRPVQDRKAVAQACAEATPTTRLLAVCTSVIVPGDALARLSGPAYNFHPGPPTRPGRYPAVFALYDGDDRFGFTVHEMRASVDSGPIVAVEWFKTPDGGLGELEGLSIQRLELMFDRLLPHLAHDVRPLPHLDVAWSGRKTTYAQAMALCRVTNDMSPEEVARRRRACGMVIEMSDPGWVEPD